MNKARLQKPQMVYCTQYRNMSMVIIDILGRNLIVVLVLTNSKTRNSIRAKKPQKFSSKPLGKDLEKRRKFQSMRAARYKQQKMIIMQTNAKIIYLSFFLPLAFNVQRYIPIHGNALQIFILSKILCDGCVHKL